MRYNYTKIEEHIRHSGDTIERFLKSIGMSISVYNQWKSGGKIPKHSQMELIASKLKLDVQQLIISEEQVPMEEEFNISKAFDLLQNAGFNVSRRRDATDLSSALDSSAQNDSISAKKQNIAPATNQQKAQAEANAKPHKNVDLKKAPSDKVKQTQLSRYSVVCPKCQKLLPTEKRTVSVEKKDVKVIKIGYCGECGKYYTDDDTLRFKDVLMGNDRVYWSKLNFSTRNSLTL